jgi:hypothetical protein
MEWRGRGQAYSYRLELLVPQSHSHFVGTIGPPSRESKTRVEFDLYKVPMMLSGGADRNPATVLVSGKIVAQEGTPDSFERRLADWNQAKREVH